MTMSSPAAQPGQYYLAMDIGCIECQEDSRVLGVFLTEEKAMQACETACRKHKNWHGHHSFKVVPLALSTLPPHGQ